MMVYMGHKIKVNSSLCCKQQEIWGPDWLHAWTYLNNYSTVSTASRYRIVSLLHNINENITKKSVETNHYK